MFRTYEPDRDRLVAVKVFRIDITPEQARSLADELVRIANTGLFHPSIVEPIGAGLEGSLAYNAEEYVAAESLDVAMRHYAPAAIETVLPFITQLAGAIDFARAAGVGHGALHPRDIFMTPDEARVTGFGVVEALERIGFRSPVRRPYSPPERIAGEGWSTPADVFSLAAVTYELLTGRRPAGLGGEIGLLTPGGADAAAAGVHAVLARAMDEEPSRRYQTALAFASDLDAAAHGRAMTDSAALAAVDTGRERPGPTDSTPSTHPRHDDTSTIDAGVVTSVPSILHLDSRDATPIDAGEDEALSTAHSPEWEELGDIAAERGEDEADHQLHLEELRGGDRADEIERLVEPAMASDSAAEAEADRFAADDFLLDAAGTAPAPERAYLDDFSAQPEEDAAAGTVPAEDDVPPEEPPSWARDTSREEEFVRTPSPSAPHQPSAPVAASVLPPGRGDLFADAAGGRQTSRLPLVLMLLVGLATGLGSGYLLWGRASPDLTDTGGEFSEDPVARPAAPSANGTGSGAGSTETARVPAPPAAPTPPTDGAEKPSAERTTPPSGGERSAAAAAETARGTPSRRGSPAPRQPTGTIVIRSTPSNAGVTVNGRWRGRTPLAVEDLPLARHEVRVVQPGYAVARQAVTLTSDDADQTVTVRLERQARSASGGRPTEAEETPARSPAGELTGSVFVDSRPRGAKVFIDSKEVGTTPLSIPNIRIGSRVVRLELPDHRTWTSTATVSAGRVTRVTGSLDRLR